ncbi:flavin reductase family protein [Bacillus alkalicellulosilyticus]|uniref:flavin reductase family protein n=1 Tax=Alkalihalobacterium alkalicellulosilyticum TaxID=1912214 RepID=UPI000998B2C2|nr:flavin reductase family protein [Bacillus alkalicellulosilyticus]
MEIDAKGLSRKEHYSLLISTVLPRPIAFVTSITEGGTVNAAPFSFFNIVTAEPPLLSIAVGRKATGEQKDTARNIATKKEFVVHIVSEDLVHQLNQTAAPYPPDVSEVQEAKLETIDSQIVTVPSIKEAKVRLECTLEQIIPLGGKNEEPASDLIIGRVVHYSIDDAIINEGIVDVNLLDPLSRLGGADYGKIGKTFSLPRPTL